MLSHNYRIRLEEICNRISKKQEVSLSDIIWCEKLAHHNAHAAKILRQARRRSQNPEMKEGDLDDFLNQMDLGNPDPREHKSHFQDADEIVDFFRRDDEDGWIRRD